MVYSETTGGDLSDNFSTPTVLTSGTDSVFGSVSESEDRNDHFIITDLMPGETAEFEFTALVGEPMSGLVEFRFSNTLNGQILASGTRGFIESDPSVSFTVPASGDVRISVEQVTTAESGGPPASTWTVSTNSVVPEPSVPALAALGALLAMRRKRK